jgi:hypothetical protein
MIYVFKTSVKTKVQAKQLKPHFAKLLPDAKWNFDLEDCDNILRVDSNENIVLPVIRILNDHRFDCEELE